MTSINENKTSKKSSGRQATVTKRSNVGYEIKYYLSDGEDGKRKRVSETIRGTKTMQS